MNAIFKAEYLEEPILLFGDSNPSPDPKLGLSLYGPYSWAKNSINIGIIGSKKTVEQTRYLLKDLSTVIQGDPKYPKWRPDFPGISRNTIFKTHLNYSEKWNQILLTNEIKYITDFSKENEIISSAVDLFIEKIRILKEREEVPDIIICSPPKEIIDSCVAVSDEGPEFKWRFKRKVSQQSLLDYMPDYRDTILEELSRKSASNFHHRLKAMSMDVAMPTQMIKPTTLDAYTNPEIGGIQHKSIVAWNLCVGLLYKAGARLWKPRLMPHGTCYVGISFYREKAVFGSMIGTSMVHVFTPDGDGLVLKGERFDWPRRGAPHLSMSGAKKLLERSLELYKQHTHSIPSRIVIHKSSSFWDEEKEGFLSALNDIPLYDFITLTSNQKSIRFFRAGYNPVIRGTLITLPDDTCLLYTKGYVPHTEIYSGPRIPLPLEVSPQLGESTYDKICREILALSKLNWNTSDFSIFKPITLHFSSQVGSILKEIPPGITPQTKYLFYM